VFEEDELEVGFSFKDEEFQGGSDELDDDLEMLASIAGTGRRLTAI